MVTQVIYRTASARGVMTLDWQFIELPMFSRRRETYFGADSHFRIFQQDLASAPKQGDVIQGLGGLRKMRWPDPRRGKGKRGGLRILYFEVPGANTIVLVDIYDKNEADDLTAEQKRKIGAAIRELKSEFLQRVSEKEKGSK
jgi:hypothetical protein